MTDKLTAAQMASVLREVHDAFCCGGATWGSLLKRIKHYEDEAARREGVETEAAATDALVYGTGWMQDGKRVEPTPAPPADERAELAAYRPDLDIVRGSIPGQFLLDPPDGGHVSTLEGVERMAARIAELELERDEAREEQKKGIMYYQAWCEAQRQSGRMVEKWLAEQARAEAAEAREKEATRLLEMYRSGIVTHAVMEGPKFAGTNHRQMRMAFEADMAALSPKEPSHG